MIKLIKGKLYNFYRRKRVMKVVRKAVFKIGTWFPDKRLVVFESFLGKSYSDNPLAIYQKLQASDKDLKYVWVFKQPNKFKLPEGTMKVRRMSLKYFWIMARARYWVLNSRQPAQVVKPKRTVFLQTWHGTPLKRLALDMDQVYIGGNDADTYKETFRFQAHQWDYLISPSPFCTEVFGRAFDFKGEFLEVGYPRNDQLFVNDDAEVQAFREKYNIPADKKILLYAPTWRDDEYIVRGKYSFKMPFDIAEMQAKLSDEYVLLVRMHYLIAKKIKFSEYGDFVIDMSSYPDVGLLYKVSDVLITDYSSVFFDYGLLKKPQIFFAYDLEKYESQLRGFYFNYQEVVPGPVCFDQDSLFRSIETIDEWTPQYEERYNQFLERFGPWDDGTASEQVIRQIWG